MKTALHPAYPFSLLAFVSTIIFTNTTIAQQSSIEPIVINEPVPLEELLLPDGFNEKIDTAHEAFADIYNTQLKQGRFDDLSYINNLLVDTSLQGITQDSAAVLLRLIEWLNARQDRDSKVLLGALNNAMFLEFHKFLSKSELRDKNIHSRALNYCDDLYNVSSPTPYGPWAPFRSSLSKVVILMNVFNQPEATIFSQPNGLNYGDYEQRKAGFAYALGAIKREMISINNQLRKEFRVSEEVIKSLINYVEIYALSEPVIKKSNLRKIVIGSAMTIIIATLFYYYVWKKYFSAEEIVPTVTLPEDKEFELPEETWPEETRRARTIRIISRRLKKTSKWVDDSLLSPAFEGAAERGAKGFLKGFAKQAKKPEFQKVMHDIMQSAAAGGVQGAANAIFPKNNAPQGSPANNQNAVPPQAPGNSNSQVPGASALPSEEEQKASLEALQQSAQGVRNKIETAQAVGGVVSKVGAAVSSSFSWIGRLHNWYFEAEQ